MSSPIPRKLEVKADMEPIIEEQVYSESSLSSSAVQSSTGSHQEWSGQQMSDIKPSVDDSSFMSLPRHPSNRQKLGKAPVDSVADDQVVSVDGA